MIKFVALAGSWRCADVGRIMPRRMDLMPDIYIYKILEHPLFQLV